MGDFLPDTLAGWLRPSEALTKLPSNWGEDAKRRAILNRLSSGHIVCGAKSVSVKSSTRGVVQSDTHRKVDASLWANWNCNDRDLWTIGDLHFDNEPPPQLVYVAGYGSEVSDELLQITYFGVRFELESFYSQLDIPEPQAASIVQQARSGRKPASWWDDLWIEIMRQIYIGELMPDAQSNIERAMHTWLSEQGHDAGETTIRDRARKLYRALQQEGGN